MTPNEKAYELVDKLYRQMNTKEFMRDNYIAAVKCAIVCVEEILSMKDLSLIMSPYKADSYRTFYTEVQIELLKTTI